MCAAALVDQTAWRLKYNFITKLHVYTAGGCVSGIKVCFGCWVFFSYCARTLKNCRALNSNTLALSPKKKTQKIKTKT